MPVTGTASVDGSGSAGAPIPAGASTTGGLTEGLQARDDALGFWRGGVVLSALEVTARQVDGALEGSAAFDVGIDTSGRVSIAILNASSEYAAWSRVANAAIAAIDPRRVRIPPGARGWHVVVKLEAKVQFPDGRRPKDFGTRFEGPKVAIVDGNLEVQMPRLTIRTKVADIHISASGVDGDFSPENIGAHRIRVVEGHLVSEGPL
jgi:hypothetical protein